MPTTIITSEKAFDRLQRLCSRSEISSGEARQKLMRWGISSAHSQAIIDRLVATRFIDDARFAGAFTRQKVRIDHWGERKIIAALRAKGVDYKYIDEAIDNIDSKEFADALYATISVKLTLCRGLLDTREGRIKLFKHALSRGFSSHDISKAISGWLSDEE